MILGSEHDLRESRRGKTKRRVDEYRFKGKSQRNRKGKNLFGKKMKSKGQYKK